MGNSFACCGKQDSDANNINTSDPKNTALSGKKLRLIVKIQAAFRGYLGRKRVALLRESSGTKQMMNKFNY